MEESVRQMAAEYARITARSREDPGTAGDEGEENWAELLRDWLPSTYHVKTKGRILTEGGFSSPQVDVLVLSPAYPPGLLDKKQYLAAGVVAAFECKLTLRATHIREAVKTAATIRRNLFVRTETPYRDLFSPLIYGVLAHSHTWTGAPSDIVAAITTLLMKADDEIVGHPREMLDVFCVADLATWRAMKVGPSYPPAGVVLPEEFAELGAQLNATYVGPTGDTDQWGPAIGSLFVNLLRRIAWEHPALRAIADYWRWTPGVSGSWGSGGGRMWKPEDAYNPRVLAKLPEHNHPTVDQWDEWSRFLF